MDRFADDPRAEKIRGYQHEIELDQWGKKLDSAENLLPVEQAYVEAFGYAQADPEKCAAKLQAVIDLYSSQSDATGPTGNCLELARRHLKQLRQEIETNAAEQLPQIQLSLDQADSLKSSEPKQAEAMYRAVIELYSAKHWAAAAVKRAKAALEASEKTGKLEAGKRLGKEKEDSPH